MTVWIYGDIHMCGVASLIVRKLWFVTQIWLMILVRLWKTFRTVFSVCLYRLFEVSYDCLNIWWYTHVWSCLTNCEKTVNFDADLIDDSCEDLKDLSNGVFLMSLSIFWGELWLFEYMGVISQVWGCLTNCEKNVRYDAGLIDDSCEALEGLSNGVFRMSLSTFWGELWLFEYMVINTCGVASLIVRKLGGVTQIWLMILVRIWKNFQTAFFLCLYRFFEVSYGCLNIWVLYHKCEVASLIARKLWGLTQIWLMILVRIWKTFQTAFFLCLYQFFGVSYGCLNIWGLYHKCEVTSLIAKKLWGVTQIWLMILVRLWKAFRTAFSVCLYRLFEVSYDCFNIWWYTHVWSCLTNCEETVRCDADLINESCEALKDLLNGVFRMSLSTFWGELWLFGYMVVISQMWSCLTNCEKTMKCDADLIDVSCEDLKYLSNGVFRMSLSTFWGELWLFEYMVIYTCVELPH